MRVARRGASPRQIGADPTALAAVKTGTAADLRALARTYAREDGIASVQITGSGDARVRVGSPNPLAAQSVDVLDPSGSALGTLTVATTNARTYLDQVEADDGRAGGALRPRGPARGRCGRRGERRSRGWRGGGPRARRRSAADRGDRPARHRAGAGCACSLPAADQGFFGSRPKVAIALLAFFGVALLAVLFTLRSLQGYVRQMLGAAKRIGDGDFTQEVPVSGGDEMAGLASEFNKMSGRLSDQMDQLRRQRLEIDKSVRRIGDAFASGLDRQALLAILAETAVGTCEADYGLVALSGHVGAEAEAGTPTDRVQEAALAAEHAALREVGPVEIEREGAFAFASSLGRIGQTGAPVGAMTIARTGRPFANQEREVFLYLVGQAAASVENVALHELVSQQAVTDDLTGLANKRAFRELIGREAARATRFGHDLSLVILDIDDFKLVNDTYGHLQGDEVLQAVAGVVAEESRGIDLPARYGGEEFVVALPETDSDGALEVAERIRARIELTAVRLIEGHDAISVTASIGVSTAPPGGAGGVEALISAADEALYEAKRRGKNRVIVAAPGGAPVAASQPAAGDQFGEGT